MASGHKKRKADLVRAYVLTPANLTNIPESKRGDESYMNKVVTLSVQNSPYSASGTGTGGPCDGSAVPFSEGSTTILANAVSNCDGNWNLVQSASVGALPYSGNYAGETAAYNNGFLRYGTVHRFFPYPNTLDKTLSDSGPLLIYSKDGPQSSNFNPFYFPASSKVLGSANQAPTSSIILPATVISAAVGNLSRVKVVFAGSIPTGTIGSALQAWFGPTLSYGPFVHHTSSVPMMSSGSFLTASLSSAGIKITYSSSLETYNKDVFTKGFFVYITGSDF